MQYIKEYNEYLNDNFKKWFGNSKMVDEQGNPKKYYHGSQRKFTEFDDKQIGSFTGNEGHYGRGHYFTDSERGAKIWGDPYGYSDKNRAIIYDVYLKIENPFIVNHDNLAKLGKKYDLNIPDEEPIAIDLKKVYEQLKTIDPISAELLNDIINNGYEKGWKVFLNRYGGLYKNVPDSKMDLNDISDWAEYGIGNIERGVPTHIIDELDKLGITDYIVYGHEYDLRMDYLTDLGQNTQGWTQAIKDDGHDGIIAGDEIVVFNSNQIKSASNNNGKFDQHNKNINENRQENSILNRILLSFLKLNFNSTQPQNYKSKWKKENIQKSWDNNQENAYNLYNKNHSDITIGYLELYGVLRNLDLYNEKVHKYVKSHPEYDDDTIFDNMDLYGELLEYLSDKGKEYYYNIKLPRFTEKQYEYGCLNHLMNLDENGLVTLYRFVKFFQENTSKYLLQYNGIGVYWSFHKNGENIGTRGGIDYIYKIKVKPEYINWERTIYKSSYDLRDELEVELLEHSEILLIGMRENDTTNNLIPKPMIINTGEKPIDNDYN